MAVLGVVLSFAAAGLAHADAFARVPDVPSSLQVPSGHKVSFRAHAAGVQIYTAVRSASDPTKLVWAFTAPEAVLYDEDGEVVGIHYAYAGPTRPAWQSASGSLVVGAR